MDRLQQLVEILRLLARTNEPNRVVLIEKAINEHLNDKAGIVRLSLERLLGHSRIGASRRIMFALGFVGWRSQGGEVAFSHGNGSKGAGVYTEPMIAADAGQFIRAGRKRRVVKRSCILTQIKQPTSRDFYW